MPICIMIDSLSANILENLATKSFKANNEDRRLSLRGKRLHHLQREHSYPKVGLWIPFVRLLVQEAETHLLIQYSGLMPSLRLIGELEKAAGSNPIWVRVFTHKHLLKNKKEEAEDMVSITKIHSTRERGHPCQTPLNILILFDILPSNSTKAVQQLHIRFIHNKIWSKSNFYQNIFLKPPFYKIECLLCIQKK